MKWQDQYSVNHPLMDQQHKQLFEILNQLEGHILKEEALDYFLETLEQLSDFAWEHFKAEETILEELKIEGLQDHMDKHQSFKKKIMAMTQSFFKQPDLKQVEEAYSFLSHWLVDHILEEDMKYKM